MTDGHGDDIYHYKHIKSNFSSNVCHQTNHDGLKQYLYEHMDSIRAYPEPEPFSLERNIAAHCGIEPEHVCATNGATEAIYLIAQAYRESHSFIKMPTFSEYADACRLHAHQVHPIYDLNRFPEKPVLIWLCNPNNPTGEVYDINLLKQLIENYPQHLFILDQSYEAFTLKRIIGVKEALAYPNVLQLHSMTKQFAVPGLRIGYVTGHPLLIGKLRKCRMPWSVNALAIAAGQYLLNHAQEYQPDIQALLKEKDRVAEALKKTGGMEVWDSDTHYMLIQLRSGRAAALKEFLATRYGILIRDASNFEGLDERFFRIAIQTPTENNQLIDRIKEWIYTC